jgi:hypothetical protein
MSLRSIIGLCDHQWEPTGERITAWRRRQHAFSIEDAQKEYRVGVREVCRCAKCGKVRSFKL